MNKDDQSIFGCVGVIIILAITIALSVIMNGYTLSVLWGWFVTPIFESAPTLTIPTAIGLGMVISFMTKEWSTTENKEHKDWGFTEKIMYAVIMTFVRPGLTLLIGWAVWQFV